MQPSAEALLSLKRHFLGALLEPSPCELEALPEPALLVAGRTVALRPDGVAVTRDADEGQVVSVWNLGAEPVTISLDGPTRAVEAQWRAGGQTAVLGVDDHAELTLRSAAGPAAEARNGPLRVRAVTLSGLRADLTVAVDVVRRPSAPRGVYDFNGRPLPDLWDFGVFDAGDPSRQPAPFQLSLASETGSSPLTVAFEELPAWLAFAVDGVERRGPAAGRFFERPAPFRASVYPLASFDSRGSQQGRVLMRTDDSRPDLRSVALEFSARFETTRGEEPTRPLQGSDVASDTWKRTSPIRVRFPVETAFIALLALLLVLAFLILVVN